ncbi:MAG: sugar phosphate nucleotidyltransferase [Anaerolineae bacterium]|nr:MAG: sugar phosphate nucleotidyltransferase [Anaerolineae bacterium]
MKVIILLAGYGKRMRPHTWSRPKPLLKVAGNTIVGHLIELLSEILTEEVIFVVGYKGDQIESWIRENYPQLDSHFVVQEEALGQAHAVWLCKDYIDDKELVVAFGDGIIDADYANFEHPEADVVLLVQKVEDPRRFGVAVLNESGFVTQFIEKPTSKENKLAVAGVTWFRNGTQLYNAIDNIINEQRQTLGEYFMADAYTDLLDHGVKIRTKELNQWADAGTPESLLTTNARLLSVGYGTRDALERGFNDGFTVIPPVYLHPSADIESAVIGPYASIDANTRIFNAVVRNSIIDPGAVVQDCVLDKALIGENARVIGQPKALFIGDNSNIRIG